MKRDPNAEALAIWLIEQQQASQMAQPQPQPGQLHLHQHHHAASPAPVSNPETQTVRLHPLFVATYMLFLSVAISVPLALIAAIVDDGNRPQVIYQQPSRRGW